MSVTAASTVAALPAITRAVEDLVHVQGHPIDLVARRLRIDVAGVRQRLDDARQARWALATARALSPEVPATKGQRTRQAVLDLARDGLDAAGIAARVGITPNSVHKVLHYARLEDPSVPRLTISTRNREIVRLALAGLPSLDVAARTGASRHRVHAAVSDARKRGTLPLSFRWAR